MQRVPVCNVRVSGLEEMGRKNGVHLHLVFVQERKADVWQGPHPLHGVAGGGAEKAHRSPSPEPPQHPSHETSPGASRASKLC